MLDETLTKLETRVRGLNSVSEEKKTELAALLVTLRQEVGTLSKTQAEQAQNIARQVALSAHEATRPDASAEDQQTSRDALSESVKEFEASHPKLVQIVNSICTTLSNLGI
ncbi:MAG: DUF4404 family protein [Verrucomicrobia bacterium]|nr:DUF4404 family protein [Verrucomicrobiota bacterium]